MQRPPIAAELLALREMPRLAEALRRRREAILAEWVDRVEQVLPEAEILTRRQVRDTIPLVLDHLIGALEGGNPAPTNAFVEIASHHGKTRFFEQYELESLVTEYRLLRQIIFRHVGEELGGIFTMDEVEALGAGVDIAVHQAVVYFVGELATQLRSAAEAEMKFLSYLSHDLRNDLNAFVLNLEVVSARVAGIPELREEAEELQGMQRSVMATMQGMERLLQAERMKRQAMPPSHRPVNVNMLAAELVGQFAPVATDKGLTLEVAVPPDAEMMSDGEILKLVLQNLVGNAIKYSQSGVVRIEAEQPREGRGWILAVRDQGPGISKERQKHIFSAFARGETWGQPGVGLGLAIASQGARLLGGKLTVHSEMGKGSRFAIEFPA